MNKGEHEGTPGLVSVVVPTYNRAQLITDALDSISSQEYRPIEIIVVDDGSTDDTADVLGQWKEANERDGELTLHTICQQNQGGNVARNRGVAEASGLYIAFLDSDDLWHPLKLGKQLAVFQGDAEIGGVYCGVQHVELETGQSVEPVSRSYPHGWLLDQMLIRDVTSPTSTYIVRKDVFDKAGDFDIDLQARQDWDMWIRLAVDFKIGCVAEALVDFREHSGPRTASNPDKEIDAYRRIMEKYAPLRVERPLAVRQAAKAAFYRRMGRVHFHYKREWWQALQYYLRAVVAWPFVFDSWAALAGLFMPASLRQNMNRMWNRVFGKTRLAIRSH